MYIAHCLGAIQILPGSLQWCWSLWKGSFLLWTREGKVPQVGRGCRLAHRVQALPLLKVICSPNSISSNSGIGWPTLIIVLCFISLLFYPFLSSWIVFKWGLLHWCLYRSCWDFIYVFMHTLESSIFAKYRIRTHSKSMLITKIVLLSSITSFSQGNLFAKCNPIPQYFIITLGFLLLSWQPAFIFLYHVSLFCSNKQKMMNGFWD